MFIPSCLMLIYEMDTVIVDDYRLRRTGWPGPVPTQFWAVIRGMQTFNLAKFNAFWRKFCCRKTI